MESRINTPSDDKDSSIDDRLDKLAEALKELPIDRLNQVEKLIHAMGKQAFTIPEVAKILDVSKDTVRRAIKRGTLKAFRLHPGGNWRISTEELNRFMRGE